MFGHVMKHQIPDLFIPSSLQPQPAQCTSLPFCSYYPQLLQSGISYVQGANSDSLDYSMGVEDANEKTKRNESRLVLNRMNWEIMRKDKLVAWGKEKVEWQIEKTRDRWCLISGMMISRDVRSLS